MRSPSPPAGKLTARELAALALLGASMYVSQVLLSALPNVHIVAVLVIVTALCYRWRALYAVAVFVLLEGLTYGFGLWWVSYLYIWPLFTVAVLLLGHSSSSLFWGIVAGIFGLSFGALCALPYLVAGGWAAAVSYWVSGIPFDLIHCVSNLILTTVLFRPLYRLIERLKHDAV